MLQLWDDLQPNVVVNIPLFGIGFDGSLERSCAEKLAFFSREKCTPFIQLSTYHVFGDQFFEDEIAEEIKVDQLDRVDSELAAIEKSASLADHHLILRISWMIDEHGIGLLDEVLPKLLSGSCDYAASANNFGRPVFAASVSDLIIAIIQQILCGSNNWGVFHFHSADSCSEAGFIDHVYRMLISEFQLNPILPEITAVDDPRRMMSGTALLGGNRLNENFGIQYLSWRNGLKGTVRNWLAEKGYNVK